MKRLWALLVIATLLTTTTGTKAYAAGSASVSISNYTKVQQGKSYTYTISVKISSSMDFIGTIKFSGVFSHDPVYLDYHAGGNSNKTLTSKVTFKIPSGAALGGTGKITVSGQGSYLDASNNVHEYNVSKSLTATVIAPIKTTPKPTAKPTPTPKPTATPVPSEWDIAVQNAAALSSGGTLGVDVTTNAKMPAALLSALKDKKGKLTVNLGNCTCAIDGASLAAVPASGDIDLAVTMDRDTALSQASGGADVYQLHFAHSGQLPGRFTYTFKATENKPGDTLYLYYYYEGSGVLEGIQTAVVDESGNVSFYIYHCSSYIVAAGIIEGAAGIITGAATEPQQTAALQTEPGTQNEPAGLETQLQDEKDKSAQLESQLMDAQGKSAQLEKQLKDSQDAALAIISRADGTLRIPYTLLIGGGCIVALIAALLTALFCRKGKAKRKVGLPNNPASPV